MPCRDLTPTQRKYLNKLHEDEFILHGTSYRTMPRNKSMWALVDHGLATWGFGPSGSWLRTYGFMPVWTDPIC